MCDYVANRQIAKDDFTSQHSDINSMCCTSNKFDPSNACNQVEGCVDPDVIAHKFCNHFKKSYTANNVRWAEELKKKYLLMREKYGGFPKDDNSHFDTETIDMKRGKAADIDGLTVGHLQHSHPVVSVLLSKFFRLILLSHCIPIGFKRSYVVPIPNPRLKTVAPRPLHVITFKGLPLALFYLKYLNNVCSSNCNRSLSRRIISSCSRKGLAALTLFIPFVLLLTVGWRKASQLISVLWICRKRSTRSIIMPFL